jgi:hypothetical protein
MGLGPFGTGTGQVSLAAAREKADEVRGILGRGGDPFTEPSSRGATSRTFGAFADEWIEGMEEGRRNEKHRAHWKSTLGTTYCASLRKRPIGEVTTDDVLRTTLAGTANTWAASSLPALQTPPTASQRLRTCFRSRALRCCRARPRQTASESVLLKRSADQELHIYKRYYNVIAAGVRSDGCLRPAAILSASLSHFRICVLHLRPVRHGHWRPVSQTAHSYRKVLIGPTSRRTPLSRCEAINSR